MFQSFTTATRPEQGPPRLAALRTELAKAGLDGFLVPRADAPWANYVRGVVKVLLDRGLALRGADLAISGNVPQGAGLSSSASAK
mgnify:CR=1 FL=1